mmetsp:Transcript_123570/g.238303  ORF Transcript_123570/g.238303 Transcript_123570/m.238303 type:complete len:1377 (-) Transcript_123570:100-4230(-)
MAVTAFDGNFSFKQAEELARIGGKDVKKMSKQQLEQFENSPFMNNIRKAESLCDDRTSTRDKARMESDPDFSPSSEDWSKAKTFDYEKTVDYYKVLGLHEYASLAEVKQAYRKLSLVYHPDKTAGMSEREKDEHQAIFLEIKNAYKLLSDQATRRQYDRDRDRDLASFEVTGHKPRVTPAFDATKVLKKMQESQKGPAQTVRIPMQCRLEKFAWGGSKVIRRTRRFRELIGFIDETKTFRLDIPAGAPENHAIVFEGMGDHHDDRRPDTLEFAIASKPHADVERQGDDLFVRQRIFMSADAHTRPYLSGQTGSVRGRHLVFWGRNPFYHATGSGAGLLRFRIKGEGLTSKACLNFEAKLGLNSSSSSAGSSTEETVVIRMQHLISKAEMAVRLPPRATIADAKAKACEVLCLPKGKVKVMRAVRGGYEQYEDDQQLGSLRSLDLGGSSWTEVPLPPARALQLLQALSGLCETDAFRGALASAYRLCQRSRSEGEAAVRTVWEGVAKILPDFGFSEGVDVLRNTAAAAMNALEEDPQTAFLREQCARLVIGFYPDAYEKSSRKTAKHLRGIAAHPSMVRRCQEREKLEPTCEVEMTRMFADDHAVMLFTKPTCTLRFYSNLHQAATRPGQLLKPRLMFAVAISCQVGAKKKGLADWIRVRDQIAPLIQETFFYMLRAARGILPRPLAPAAAFRDEQYSIDEDVITFSGADQLDDNLDECCSESDGATDSPAVGSEDDCRVVTGGGGGFFDFDDLEESQEVYVKKQKDREERRRAQHAQRAARRAARLELRREALLAKRREEQQLARAQAASSTAQETRQREVRQLPVPWARLGDDAVRRDEHWLAACHYGERIRELRKAGLFDEALVCILSKRSACFAQVGQFDASLSDAKVATEIKVERGEAWSRVGFAASSLGPEFLYEAKEAYSNAVQYDPLPANVDALHRITRWVTGPDADAAHQVKEEGNEALQSGEPGRAIACYTIAVAQVPKGISDRHNVLLAALYANRSLAFAKLGNWEAAVRDARQAVAVSSLFVKARHRLGTALLGSGLHEQAYCEFAIGLQMDPKDQLLRRGRDACLGVLPLWQSTDARARFRARFTRDMTRPKGSTRIFAISDIHFDHKRNQDWVRNIDEVMFREDVLIVAGNIGDTLKALTAGLRLLRTKFRRVFYTVGNHDLWIHPSEAAEHPDSLAKFLAILQACDELEVDVFPAAISEGAFVVPLFSWYNAEFDEKDPFPEPTPTFDTHCKWPLDADTQVWKFFLSLNTEHLRLPYHGTVITFAHFLPRQGLPYDKTVPKSGKAMGCEDIDDQVRSIKSKLHVFGHSRKRYSKVEEGVVYVNHPLGFENEHSDCEPVMCVFNGTACVQRPMQINDWLGRHV